MFVRYVVISTDRQCHETRITEFPSYEDAEMYICNSFDTSDSDYPYCIKKLFYPGVDPMLEVQHSA